VSGPGLPTPPDEAEDHSERDDAASPERVSDARGVAPNPAAEVAHIAEQSNPLAAAVGVTVAVPKSIRVQMVDASALAQFQYLGLATSILSSAVIGFLVAYLQTATRPTHLLIETIVWGLLFGIALIATLRTRKALRPESEDVPFGVMTEISQQRTLPPSEARRDPK
jgi:hypothetical protein